MPVRTNLTLRSVPLSRRPPPPRSADLQGDATSIAFTLTSYMTLEHHPDQVPLNPNRNPMIVYNMEAHNLFEVIKTVMVMYDLEFYNTTLHANPLEDHVRQEINHRLILNFSSHNFEIAYSLGRLWALRTPLALPLLSRVLQHTQQF